MIIVKLHGGLGNQMFQYAFGYYLAEKYQTELKFDLSSLLDHSSKNKNYVFRDFDLSIFGIEQSVANKKDINKFKMRLGIYWADKILNKIIGLKKTYITEPHFHFSKEVFECTDDVYIEGYFQSEKYFALVKEQLKKKFIVKQDTSVKQAALTAEICSKNSICVNVRRGDFVVNPFHGTLPPDYYSYAEDIILNAVGLSHIYVFSDDLAWCKQNLKFKSPVTFVSHDYAGEKFKDYLRLMSCCKHFIIPNSTFAWWAAYLAPNKTKMVVTPRKWHNDSEWDTKDLLLDDWIKIG